MKTVDSSDMDVRHYPRPSVARSGLSIVYQPEDSDPVLDIVFVHGLGGHPEKTWTAGRTKGQDKKLDTSDKNISDITGLWSKLKSLRPSKDSTKGPSISSFNDPTPPIFWPADLLPARCPKARILVFGYDSAVAKRQSVGVVNRNSIFAHGRDLANELGRTHPSARPVLFIVHSLGGIVIKETLSICSTSGHDEFRGILQSTVGVVFLGTPHRGSPLADIGEIARKAASISLMDTSPRILDSLSLRNSDLERCQDAFSSLWLKHKFQVKTFQEGLPMKLPIWVGRSKMAKVVPDTSSCLGDSRERAETLNGDHRTICRYPNAEDPNFKKVAAEVEKVYSGCLKESKVTLSLEKEPDSSSLPPPNTTDKRLNKLEHFRFKEMLLRQLAINPPADSTCQWLSSTKSFRIWIDRTYNNEHPGLLQIIGKPGSGKSTLMKRIYEVTRHRFKSQNDSDTHVLSHFFNARGHALERSMKGLLHSILYQLGTLHPPSLQALDYSESDLHLLESRGLPFYLNILKSSLRKILSDPLYAPPRTIIFIDALDECDVTEALGVGHFLAELTKASHRSAVQLDVCLSRREFPHMTVRNCLEIHMEEYNEADIRQFVHHKLQLMDTPAQYALALQNTVAQRSNGIFLWAVLAVEGIIEDMESGKNAKQVLGRTQSLPKVLEDLFRQMLDQMNREDVETALRLFQWAVLATAPLRIHEWHHILAFLHDDTPTSLKEWKESDDYTETDAQLERRIRTLSRGLIEVRVSDIDLDDSNEDAGSISAYAGSLDSAAGQSRIVQPIHETVTEFFVSGRANQLLWMEKGYLFSGEGHLFIARTCLRYLALADFDELATARGLQNKTAVLDEGSGNSPEKHPTTIDHSEDGASTRPLRRRRSGISFMSSASAHSIHSMTMPRDIFASSDSMADWPLRNNIPPSRENSILMLESSSSEGTDQVNREDPPFTLEDLNPPLKHSKSIFSRSSEALDEHFPHTSDSGLKEDTPYGGERSGQTPEIASLSFSSRPQILAEYPALASYAINRAFVHARAGRDLGADPTEVIDELIIQKGWYRWFVLQEDLDSVESWKDLLEIQGLASWISLADEEVEYDRRSKRRQRRLEKDKRRSQMRSASLDLESRLA